MLLIIYVHFHAHKTVDYSACVTFTPSYSLSSLFCMLKIEFFISPKVTNVTLYKHEMLMVDYFFGLLYTLVK